MAQEMDVKGRYELRWVGIIDGGRYLWDFHGVKVVQLLVPQIQVVHTWDWHSLQDGK